MPLTKTDILNTLADPVLNRMDFYVGTVHVYDESFGYVRELILDDNIQLVQGTESNVAYYNASDDTLTLQNAASPPNVDARALLVHECVHALVDLKEFKVTALTNEVASYLAQVAYTLRSDPARTAVPDGTPWGDFFAEVYALAKAFNLHTPRGRGAKLTMRDYKTLQQKMQKLPGGLYGHLKPSTRSHVDGVKMRYLNLRQPVYPSRTTATAPDDSHIELPGDVLFDFDKDVVKAEAEPTLAQVAGVVRSHLAGAPKGSYVMVNGHTDNVGAAGYNEALSERRAQAVARWLVDRKYVTAEQVKTQGWGETRPKTSNKRPGGRRLNRRVEFFVRKM